MQHKQYYQPSRRPNLVTPPPKQRRRFSTKTFLRVVAFIGIVYIALGPLHALAWFHTPTWAEKTQPLITTLDDTIAKLPYQAGIAITNVKTGETITAGSKNAFVAASTTKLITAATYYHLVETGHASLDQQLGAWPASFQLKSLVTISNNDAWEELKTIATDQAATQFLSSHHLSYDPASNTITPSQMSQFLSALYNGQLLSKNNTKTLLSYMRDTNMEQMLPAITPSSLTLYHKYGLFSGALHDVGIVSDGTNSYAISIYTQNGSDADALGRIVTIRQLASTVLKVLFPGITPLIPKAPTQLEY